MGPGVMHVAHLERQPPLFSPFFVPSLYLFTIGHNWLYPLGTVPHSSNSLSRGPFYFLIVLHVLAYWTITLLVQAFQPELG